MPEAAAAAVLVVDPDVESAARICAMLESLSLVAEHVRSGSDAIAALDKHSYRLVVTELSLSGVDGFALIQRLRSMPTAKQTRVVVVSGFIALRAAAMQHRVALGIDDVVARGGGAEALLRSLRRVLEARPIDPDEATGRTAHVHAGVYIASNGKVATTTTPAPETMTHTTTTATPAPAPTLSAMVAVTPPRANPEGVHRERARLAAVGRATSVSTDPELQRIVDAAAADFAVGAALVNFVHADIVTVAAGGGTNADDLEKRGISRDGSFCRHVVEADTPVPLVVPDASLHPVLSHNPLVVDGTIRSYVGTPLFTSSGQCLGTLCLIDSRPSRLGEADVERLRILARKVSGHLEFKAAQRRQHERDDAVSRAEAELQDNTQRIHARWAAVFDALDIGVLLMSAHDRTVRFASAAIGEVFNVDEGALVGTSRAQTLRVLGAATNDVDAFVAALAAPDEGTFAGTAVVTVERPGRRVLRWSDKPVVIDDVTYQLTTFTDITAEAALIAHNEKNSSTDHLTGLLNRRGFDSALNRELARQARRGTGLAVIVIDIDNFKKRNDTFGHAKGDEALVAVADAIAGAARTVDVVARIGGEEFVVVAVDADLDAATVVAERIRVAVENLALDTGTITVSAGVATVVAGGGDVSRDDVDDALSVADAALYVAKGDGRNRVVASPSRSE
jgi:diguanylate cyclase (GGDEF)-like protein